MELRGIWGNKRGNMGFDKRKKRGIRRDGGGNKKRIRRGKKGKTSDKKENQKWD